MVLALSPIFRAFPQQLKSVYVVTLQAISGAGYPGLPSLDILDNVSLHTCNHLDYICIHIWVHK